MRVKTVTSAKGSVSYSIIKDITKDGKRTTKVVKTLGNADEIRAAHPGVDPKEYAESVAKKLTQEEKEGKHRIISVKDKTRIIERGRRPVKLIGHLFIDQIFHQLKLDKMCDDISKKHRFKFDLTSILKMLLSTRVLYPKSKKASYQQAQDFIEKPDFKEHDVYRALDVIAEHNDEIQEFVYKSSKNIIKRNDSILYYDCTNFFFESDEAINKKQYGVSKENRPNPIIQMGMFMDGSGIPLAFTTFPGNQNEQPSLKPLERKIIKDFELSKFVVCTDAGLSSYANRRFNNIGNRAYITTQSIKKLEKRLKEWCLDPVGWIIPNNPTQIIDLRDIDLEDHYNTVFYKEKWIVHKPTKEEKQNNIRPLEEKIIVTFSPKYKFYQEGVRERQIQRALKKIESPSKMKKKNANDPNRFINVVSVTENGEVCDQQHYTLNQTEIDKEAMYDGFYAVCTNLEADPSEIVKINRNRWEIEETFRILKSEFKARPVYLRKEDRIDAHFVTCFLALILYRILENKLDEKYTCSEIIGTLREMMWYEIPDEGYVPAYERTEITDKLHDNADFRTDYEILDYKMVRNTLKFIKNGER